MRVSQTHRLALLVFAPVQNSPVDLSGIPLGQESRLAFSIQELENLQSKTDVKQQHDKHYKPHRAYNYSVRSQISSQTRTI